MKKSLLTIVILLVVSTLLCAQKRKGSSYVFKHNLKPFLVLNYTLTNANYTVNSPHAGAFSSQLTNILIPSCYTYNKVTAKVKSEFIDSKIEYFKTAEGTPLILNEELSYVILKYHATVTVKEKDETMLVGRIVSPPGDSVKIPILNPSLLGVLKKGSKSAIDSIIDANKYSIVSSALTNVNNIIENNFCGYYKSDTMFVFTAKGKNFDYSELESTETSVKTAVSNLNSKNGDTTLAFWNLKKAIEIWEKELSTSDLTNPKARINEEITKGLYYNISSAYFFLGNYPKADSYIKKAFKQKDTSKKINLYNNFDITANRFAQTISLYLNR